MWNPLQRFLRTLAGVDDVPRRPEQMRVEHAEFFADSVAATMQELYAWRFVEHVADVLRLMSPTGRVPNTLDVLRVRTPGQPRHVTGHSEGELRRLLAAARADVAAMRKRITHGRALLGRSPASPLWARATPWAPSPPGSSAAARAVAVLERLQPPATDLLLRSLYPAERIRA